MTTSTYMAALAALDEAPREEVSQVFISPLGADRIDRGRCRDRNSRFCITARPYERERN